MSDGGFNVSQIAWAGGAALGYLLLWWGSPARTALRDGWRVVSRYPAMIRWLAVIGFWQAAAASALRIWSDFGNVDPGSAGAWGLWSGWNPPSPGVAVAEAVLPAVESTAGLFNSMVGTFPVSAFAAMLWLVDWRRSRSILCGALRKRSGFWSVMWVPLLLLSALSSVAKPVLIALTPWSVENAPLGTATLPLLGIVERLGFLFEYAFAVWLQILLLTISCLWVRGMRCEPDAARDFSLRRFAVVFRWSLPLYIAGAFLIELPLALEGVIPGAAEWTRTTRWLFCMLLFVCPIIQMRLVFHNESLGQAFQDQREYWRRHAGQFGWFALSAFLLLLPMWSLDRGLRMALGENNLAVVCWSLVAPVIWAPLAAWLLASWVCHCKQTESSRPGIEDWVNF